MSDAPRTIPRLAVLLVAVLPFLSGCLHYDERGTIAADGSGEVRVVYSMGPGGELDKEKQAEVRARVAATECIEILGDVDSTDGDTTWVGMHLRFASLGALGAIDTILPLKGMFQNVQLVQEGDAWSFRRTVRLLPAPTEGMDMPHFRQILTWVVPGKVVHADSLGRWSEGDHAVVWTLPNDGRAGTSAELEVRWIDADTVRVALPWTWIGIGAVVLALLVVFLLLFRRKASRAFVQAASLMPESVNTPPVASSSPAESTRQGLPTPEASSLADIAAVPTASGPSAMAPESATSSRRFRPGYFLSPSLLLAAFGLFVLAPVVNISCMGRTQQMTGWQLAHQSPDFRSQLGEMQDMAETIGSGEDLRDKSLEEAASGTARSQRTNEVTIFLWGILVVAGLCVVFPWERAQGLAAFLFGGGLVAFQHKLGGGLAHPIPEVARVLKIERLAPWYVVETLLVLVVLSGLWSIVSSLRGGRVRRGWIPTVLVVLLAAAVGSVLVLAAKGELDQSRTNTGIDTTSTFEMPTDTDVPGSEGSDTATEGGS